MSHIIVDHFDSKYGRSSFFLCPTHSVVDIGPLKAKMTNHIFTRGFQYFYEFLLNVIEDRKNNQEASNFVDIRAKK